MSPALLSLLSESRALVFLLGIICGGTLVALMALLAATYGRPLKRSDAETIREIIERARRA